MKSVLLIHSSPNFENSTSSKLGQKIVEKLKKEFPDLVVKAKNLSKDCVPHWTQDQVTASFVDKAQRTVDQAALLKMSDRLVDEIKEADAIVLCSPMWNFSVPSQLKAWIDHIVRVGLTFEYSPNGPRGLLDSNKRLFLALSSGGIYSEGTQKEFDFLEPYLKTVFQFLGLNRIQTFKVEGTAMPSFTHASIEKEFIEINNNLKF